MEMNVNLSIEDARTLIKLIVEHDANANRRGESEIRNAEELWVALAVVSGMAKYDAEEKKLTITIVAPNAP